MTSPGSATLGVRHRPICHTPLIHQLKARGKLFVVTYLPETLLFIILTVIIRNPFPKSHTPITAHAG